MPRSSTKKSAAARRERMLDRATPFVIAGTAATVGVGLGVLLGRSTLAPTRPAGIIGPEVGYVRAGIIGPEIGALQQRQAAAAHVLQRLGIQPKRWAGFTEAERRRSVAVLSARGALASYVRSELPQLSASVSAGEPVAVDVAARSLVSAADAYVLDLLRLGA